MVGSCLASHQLTPHLTWMCFQHAPRQGYIPDQIPVVGSVDRLRLLSAKRVQFLDGRADAGCSLLPPYLRTLWGAIPLADGIKISSVWVRAHPIPRDGQVHGLFAGDAVRGRRCTSRNNLEHAGVPHGYRNRESGQHVQYAHISGIALHLFLRLHELPGSGKIGLPFSNVGSSPCVWVYLRLYLWVTQNTETYKHAIATTRHSHPLANSMPLLLYVYYRIPKFVVLVVTNTQAHRTWTNQSRRYLSLWWTWSWETSTANNLLHAILTCLLRNANVYTGTLSSCPDWQSRCGVVPSSVFSSPWACTLGWWCSAVLWSTSTPCGSSWTRKFATCTGVYMPRTMHFSCQKTWRSVSVLLISPPFISFFQFG